VKAIYVIVGLNVLLVFSFKRAWLLNTRPYLLLLAFNIALFIAGFLLPRYDIGDPKLVVMLKVPLIYQLVFWVMLTIFRLLFHKDPAETFWTSDRKLLKDGIFNFIYIMALVTIIILLT
jgi:hypothetical protein